MKLTTIILLIGGIFVVATYPNESNVIAKGLWASISGLGVFGYAKFMAWI